MDHSGEQVQPAQGTGNSLSVPGDHTLVLLLLFGGDLIMHRIATYQVVI